MKTIFNLAAARLAMEISDCFCREAIASVAPADETLIRTHKHQSLHAILSDLKDTLISLIEETYPALKILSDNLMALQADSQQLHQTNRTLQFILFTGIIESVHTNAQDSVGTLLRQVESRIAAAQNEFQALDADVTRLLNGLAKAPVLLDDLCATFAANGQRTAA